MCIAQLAKADLVFLGEQHNDPRTHQLETAVVEGIARRRHIGRRQFQRPRTREQAVAQLPPLSQALKGWRFVLDPGHGGLDPGAVVQVALAHGVDSMRAMVFAVRAARAAGRVEAQPLLTPVVIALSEEMQRVKADVPDLPKVPRSVAFPDPAALRDMLHRLRHRAFGGSVLRRPPRVFVDNLHPSAPRSHRADP